MPDIDNISTDTINFLKSALMSVKGGRWQKIIPPSFIAEDASSREIIFIINEIIEKASKMEMMLKKANEKNKRLTKQIFQISTLYDIGQEMTSTHDISSIIEMILSAISGSIGVEVGVVLMYDKDRGVLVPSAKRGIEIDIPPIPIDEKTAEILAVEMSPIDVNDHKIRFISELHSREDKILEKMQARLWIPIISRGQFVGIISLGNKFYDEDFTEDDIKTLFIIATTTGTAIQNAKAFSLIKKSKEELDRKVERISLLYNVSQDFTSTLELNKLVGVVIERLISAMEAESGSLWLVDDNSGKLVCKIASGPAADKILGMTMDLGKGIVGSVTATGKSEIIQDTRNDPRFAWQIDKKTGYITKSMLCVPLQIKGKKLGAVQIINKIKEGEQFTHEDLELLEAITNNAAGAIENARLYLQLKEQERMKKELEIARNIQTSLLPKKLPKREGFDIYGKTEPAKEVGGDFYDFIRLSDDSLGIVIADVSDKGVSAGLFMAMCKTLLLAFAKDEESPSAVLSKVNNIIVGVNEADMFVTIFYAILNFKTKIMKYSNAGHNPPFIHRPENQEMIFLKTRGSAVGVFEDLKFEDKQIELQKGDTVVFFTDGIIEAVNEKKEEFRQDRLIATLKDCVNLSSAEILDNIYETVKNFCGAEPQFDDMTMVVLKVS